MDDVSESKNEVKYLVDAKLLKKSSLLINIFDVFRVGVALRVERDSHCAFYDVKLNVNM